MSSALCTPTRTAVCVSGQCRSLDRTYANIYEYILSRIGGYDLFVYTCDDSDARHAALLHPTVLKVVPDSRIDETGCDQGMIYFAPGHLRANKHPVQNYLQQLYALKQVHEMRLEYERSSGIRYDWVIRLRPDSWFIRASIDLHTLHNDLVYVPRWGGFGWPRGSGTGINDRFAIGAPAAMEAYFNQFDHIREYAPTAKSMFTPEMATKLALKNAGVQVDFIDVAFGLFRKNAQPPTYDQVRFLVDVCKWEYAFRGDRRPISQTVSASASRVFLHVKRLIGAL
jgi:hypothetical protein